MSFQKIKWALGIFLVFFLILSTNFIDRNSFLRVKTSIENIYEDRLIAKDLINDLNLIMHEKQLALAACQQQAISGLYPVNEPALNELIYSFKQTQLIPKETERLRSLEQSLQAIKKLEQAWLADTENQDLAARLAEKLSEAQSHLYDLSKLQVEEGKRQMHLAQRAINSVELLTKMELIILLALALLVQVIILYTPKESLSGPKH